MKTALFRKLLHALDRHTPGPVAAMEIQILLRTTARGFGVRGRRVWHYGQAKALREYAAFTQTCMQGGADPQRLYEEAFKTGRRVGRITGFTDREDIASLVFYLYKNIGISMSGRIPGEVLVSGCYFSKCYSPAQCRVMSAVDAGIIAGIAGGGDFTFTERITEGGNCCRACLITDREGGRNHA